MRVSVCVLAVCVGWLCCGCGHQVGADGFPKMIANVAPVGASRNATALYTVHNIVDQADIPCSWMSEVGTSTGGGSRHPPRLMACCVAGVICVCLAVCWLQTNKHIRIHHYVRSLQVSSSIKHGHVPPSSPPPVLAQAPPPPSACLLD